MIRMRLFIQRFLYQKYDSSSNNYVKTVMAEKLDIDLKDDAGNFNCGKPSGYIKDFDALSQDMKELIRSIKRTRSLYGTVTFIDATAERKGPSGMYYIPVCEADLNTVHDIVDSDQTLLRDFKAVVENHNRRILSEWEEKQVAKATEEEKELAESFVEIDVEEVE